jgi:predicted glycosyltransferase
LYVSSPVGLGHVRRDLAIASELRARHPDLEFDWLTQHPVTQVLQERGERVHPASRWLASESAHIESEAGEYDLNVFQAARRMDEIMVANFMVFPRPGLRRAVRPVCLVSVGGSGVGAHLLRRVASAFPLAEKAIPGLRMIAVTGLRIDPASVPVPEGVELRGYVPDLYQHLAACDLAVVQGGLTATMELVAARRPFTHVPLARHFEQQIHVAHRLAQYRAGRRLDYAALDPGYLAKAIAAEIDRPVDYRPGETDGAERAAALLAELL